MKSRIRQNSISGIAPAFLFSGRSASLTLMILASLILVLGLIKPQFMTDARMGVTDIFTPVLSAFSSPFQNMAEAVGSVSGVTAIRAENIQLKAENIRLKEWYQTALMLQAENQSLQELLDLKVDPSHKYLTARVMSDSGNSYVKTVLISSGSEEGVKKNQAVLSGDGMIGRVHEVGKKSARILLINDINSRVPVLIEGSSQKAIMAGDNSQAPVLKHLPQDAGVLEGARVITSGHGGVFPKGLPIGRVVKNTQGKLIVKTYADMNKVIFVRIVDSTLNQNLRRTNTQSLLN